jgi:hypothetical protein
LDPPPNQLPATRQVHTAEEAAGRGVRAMFTRLSDTNKAAIFAVLVLCMPVGAVLLIRILSLTGGMGMWTLWSFTPTVATLVMLLVLTRDGYSKEGWKSLGLHRLGLNVWWIAFGGTLLLTVAVSVIVWATSLTSFVVPEGGIIDPLIGFLIMVGVFALTFALGEEIDAPVRPESEGLLQDIRWRRLRDGHAS